MSDRPTSAGRPVHPRHHHPDVRRHLIAAAALAGLLAVLVGVLALGPAVTG